MTAGILAYSPVPSVPAVSWGFPAAGSNLHYMSMAKANFGDFAGQNYTICGWFKYDINQLSAGAAGLFRFGSATQDVIALRYQATVSAYHRIASDSSASGTSVSSTISLVDGIWYFVALSYNGSNLNLAVRALNGAAVGGGDWSASRGVLTGVGSEFAQWGRNVIDNTQMETSLYQATAFIGEAKNITELVNAPSGSTTPKSLALESGLTSQAPVTTLTADSKLATAWTNTGSVTLSTDIPV